jgi:hypothetical protein
MVLSIVTKSIIPPKIMEYDKGTMAGQRERKIEPHGFLLMR